MTLYQNFRKRFAFEVVKASNGDAWFEIQGEMYSPSQIGAICLNQNEGNR